MFKFLENLTGPFPDEIVDKLYNIIFYIWNNLAIRSKQSSKLIEICQTAIKPCWKGVKQSNSVIDKQISLLLLEIARDAEVCFDII
mmetsp:Transcript_22977/g.3783  ORF Transcript_22977/g.3783 Transcript_22977/m.3783 type:complete len:86 (+) Transcript_22977:412-669(+)